MLANSAGIYIGSMLNSIIAIATYVTFEAYDR